MTTEPNRRPADPDFAAPINAAVDAAYRRWQNTPNRAAYVHTEMVRLAYEVAEKASGMMVATTLRTIAEGLDRTSAQLPPGPLVALLREQADSAERGFEVSGGGR